MEQVFQTKCKSEKTLQSKKKEFWKEKNQGERKSDSPERVTRGRLAERKENRGGGTEKDKDEEQKRGSLKLSIKNTPGAP